MKTVLIFDQCGQEPIKFVVLDGDYERFSGVYINAVVEGTKKQRELGDKLQEELGEVLYGTDSKFKISVSEEFPCDAVKEGALVVVCGFLP